MRSRFDTTLSVILTIAAVVLTVVVVRREWIARNANWAAPTSASDYYSDWRDWLSSGVLVGVDSAPAMLVVFGDLQCPACKWFHEHALAPVKAEFASSLSVTFLHMPLRTHPLARPAAEAAECADEQGRFTEFVDVVFGKQDSLGVKAWASYAQDAAVPDLQGFESCITDARPKSRIDDGRGIADRIGLSGTPTVLLNGWKFARTPTEVDLAQAVRNVLSGREPHAQWRVE